jgi:hypothetical protein
VTRPRFQRPLRAVPLVALIVGVGGVTSASAATLDPALCAPDQNTFTLTINNSFFPLTPVGRAWLLEGVEGGQNVGLRITVLNATNTFYSGRQKVTTRVLEEREWSDANANGSVDSGENLAEVSLNYFAQTAAGTVCYFGEHVDSYAGGVVVSHEGSWRADDPGNAPGIFMPASPATGMKFQQEFAPGIAEDTADIIGTGTVTVPAGTFRDAIRVRESNPLEPGKSYKTYARGVGITQDDTLNLISF